MTGIIESATIHAGVIVIIVEALKQRIPDITGWRVLALAAVVAIALGFLFVVDPVGAGWRETIGTAVFSWAMAIGGNAWISKLAGKVGGVEVNNGTKS